MPTRADDIKVKELTTREVRAMFVELEAGAPVDPVRALVFEDCTLDDLSRLSDASIDQLEDMPHAELEKLRARCKAANPHFFRGRELLARISRELSQRAEAVLLPSTGPLPK